ncbi:MAG TPA: lactate utilization protein [Pyrinomonadaceae bacterium]|nr:lactate utilization protein [Pyrinomonadaceae bacterium]
MSSREAILKSIRTHLEASAPHDEPPSVFSLSPVSVLETPVVELFKQSLEAVNGHCIVVENEDEMVQAVTRILGDGEPRIAISDAPLLNRLIGLQPYTGNIFDYDVGISTAQAAIAETGTLVLDSARERHRLVSLVPPVHIAIINAASIFQTLAEALAFIHRNGDISPAVTFITGPSRTADIELTLAIGVHGPQELFVIVNRGPSLSN